MVAAGGTAHGNTGSVMGTLILRKPYQPSVQGKTCRAIPRGTQPIGCLNVQQQLRRRVIDHRLQIEASEVSHQAERVLKQKAVSLCVCVSGHYGSLAVRPCGDQGSWTHWCASEGADTSDLC